MDNRTDTQEVAQLDQAPLVTLEQLYAFRDHLNRLIANRGVTNPLSESERHLRVHGHRLAYGCCRDR